MRLDSRGKSRDRGWSIVENGVRVGEQTTVSEIRREESTLSRVPGTVLADRFPANNWKCKRNRPPCDSSIIESLISVWMRPLSRFRALCPNRSRTPSPFRLSSSGAISPLSSARYRQSLPILFAMSSSFTCWNASWRRVLPTNEQMRRVRRAMLFVQVRTCC